MGYKFSELSKKRLATCHLDIQKVMNEAIKTSPIDFTITCGHRGKEEQNQAVKDGFSSKLWPKGNHNAMPSNAVDITPYPKMWKAPASEWVMLHNHINATSKRLGIPLRWGGDWDGDGDLTDQKLVDKPHWELKK